MAIVTPFGMRYNRKLKKFVETSKTSPTFEYTLPDGFCLVRDTREQIGTGLFVKPPKGLIMVRDTLKVGDYSCKGFEEQIAIERKSLPDLWSSLTVDADRFRRELEVLATYERKWLLIEALESSFLSFQEGRKIHPNSIRGALVSIEVRLGIPVWQSESREAAERWVIDRLCKYYKWKRGL